MVKGLSTFLYGVLTEDALTGKATYATPAKLSGAIEASVDFETNNAEVYADNVLAASDYSISKATLTLGILEGDDAIFAPLLGKTVTKYTAEVDGEVDVFTTGVNDTAKFVGFGYILNGEGKYIVEFFKKVKFTNFSLEGSTKRDTVEYQTPTVTGTATALADGTLETKATFTNMPDAVAFLKSLFVAA